MPSLRELRAHAPLLLIDAASAVVQVGLFAADGSARWETSEEEAGVGVFVCLERLGVELASVRAFAFCDGPGSVLGIRSVAMALRTWNVLEARPTFAFCSLAVVAHALARPELAVIADARRDAWHHYQLGQGLKRVPTAALSGPLAMPESFRNWTPLPSGVERVSYSLAQLLPGVDAVEELFLPTDAPDAFLHEEPSYVMWTPQIHRAPGEK